LPDRDLISALNIASMRGVEVSIVLPRVNNQPLVGWASTALHWQLLERGCRVFLTPPPFDHTKLMVVDGVWTLIGSANWDPRSLRLNFEFNVECYDSQLAQSMVQLVEGKLQHAHEVTLKEVDGRPLSIRLRDGVARLFSPYI
jgi:cardiolipin synthase